MDKKSLRKLIRERKNAHTNEELALKSKTAINMLEAHEWFKRATTVCLYASLGDEVYTLELIEKYRDSKRILLPTVKDDIIELHEYGQQDDTQIGKFGINESCGPLFTDYDHIELIVVPGMAFDEKGNRLGRGKGYYDKFLPLIKANKVGLCFDFQMVDTVPTLPYDIRMDAVIHSSSAPEVPSGGHSEMTEETRYT